jgi:hypothetical protein
LTWRPLRRMSPRCLPSIQRDRLGRLNAAQGERLREGLLDLAESQGDKATIATLTGYAGLAAEKSGDLDTAVRWWRRAIAAGAASVGTLPALFWKLAA